MNKRALAALKQIAAELRSEHMIQCAITGQKVTQLGVLAERMEKALESLQTKEPTK